jgi:hypothetical protein
LHPTKPKKKKKNTLIGYPWLISYELQSNS